MLINYGFALSCGENALTCLELTWGELENAFCALNNTDTTYIRKRYRSWDYGSEEFNVREESPECTFRIMYDRIPFKIDDLFDHIFEAWYQRFQ